MSACTHCCGSGVEPPPIAPTISARMVLKTVSEANQRNKWQQVKRKAEQREVVGETLAELATAGDGLAYLDLPAVEVTLVRITPSSRGLDDDNLASAFKAIRDEVAKWLGVDDRDPRVSWKYAQEKGPPKTNAVRIEFRRCRGQTP
jgi:hypothetical protein